MKKLSAEEAVELRPLKKGKYNWLYKELMLIKQGEAIIIRFSDWKTKDTPYRTVRRSMVATGFKIDYGLHPDGSGWLVKRVG